MSEEEWGPWIEHDGKGYPCKLGFVYHIVYADGSEVTACNRGQSAAEEGLFTEKPYDGPTWASSWLWYEPGGLIPVQRYRIRKPSALQELKDLVEDLPEEVDA